MEQQIHLIGLAEKQKNEVADVNGKAQGTVNMQHAAWQLPSHPETAWFPVKNYLCVTANAFSALM